VVRLREGVAFEHTPFAVLYGSGVQSRELTQRLWGVDGRRSGMMGVVEARGSSNARVRLTTPVEGFKRGV
jgi:hypothetical protein